MKKRKKAQNQPLVIVNGLKPLDGNFQRISTVPNVHQKLPGRRGCGYMGEAWEMYRDERRSERCLRLGGWNFEESVAG